MSRRIAEFILKTRLWWLAVILLITLGFIYEIAVNLTVQTKFPDLLPQKHPFIKFHNTFRTNFGGANMVVMAVTVKRGDIYNYETLSKIAALNEEMIFLPSVDRYKVYSIADQKVKNVIVDAWGIKAPSLMWPLAPKSPEGIKKLKDAIYSNDMYYGGYVSCDGKSALLLADFFEENINYNLLYTELEKLRKKYEDENHRISIVGMPLLLGLVNQLIKQTMIIGGLILIIILILLLCFFSFSRRLIFIPMLNGIINGIWGLGMFSVFRFNLEPLMIVIPLLLICMAISHNLQLIKRYTEEYNEKKGKFETAVSTLEKMLLPNLAGIITDAMGIFIIAICPIPVFQRFGIVCGIWALLTVVLSLILGCIMLSYFSVSEDRIKKHMNKVGLIDYFTKFCEKCAIGGIKWNWSVIIITIALLVGFGIYIPQVYFGDVHEGSSILWPDSRYNTDAKVINGPFTGLQNTLLVVLEGKEKIEAKKGLPPKGGIEEELHKEAFYAEKESKDYIKIVCLPEAVKMAEEFQRKMILHPAVGGSISFVDLLKKVTMLLYLQDRKWDVLPGDYYKGVQNLHIIENTSRPGELDAYYTSDKQAMSIKIFVRDHKGETVFSVMNYAKNVIKEIEKKYPEAKVRFRLAGGVIGVEAATLATLKSFQKISFIMAILLVFIINVISFRSFVAGILLTIPLLVSNYIVLAYMAIQKIGITVSSYPVFSIGIGLGVDFGIYILARIVDEAVMTKNFQVGISNAIRHTGTSVVYIALTLVGGTIFWYFSDLMFQAYMGFLVGMILLIDMLSAIIILPVVVNLIKPKFIMAKIG